MTVQIFTRKVSYTGNNSTSVYYPIPYPYLDESAWIEVSAVDASGSVTELVPSTDFIVVAGQGVLTTAAWDSGYTLTISRSATADQLMDYVENSKFPAESHEYALDKLTMVCQDIVEELSRCVRVSIVSGGLDDIDAVNATDKVFGLDDSGNTTLYSPLELLDFLTLSGSIENSITAVWADDAERATTVPKLTGQIGIQLDQTGLNAFYRSTSTSAGAWQSARTPIGDGLEYDSGNILKVRIGTGLQFSSGVLEVSGSLTAGSLVVFADATQRAASTPSYIGQLGIQIDTGSLYRSTATTVGAWLGSMDFDGLLTAPNQTAAADQNVITRALGDARYMLTSVGALVVVTMVTASDPNFAYNAATNHAFIDAIGGGGGGGGTPSLTGSQSCAGQGGMSGVFGRLYRNVAAMSTKETSITIGAAGTAGSGGVGGNGGSTTIDDEVSTQEFLGGTGGGTNTQTGANVIGQRPATRTLISGSDVVFAGQMTSTEPSILTDPAGTTHSAKGGDGANSPFGSGGRGSITTGTSGAGNSASEAAQGYGSGGAGASAILGLSTARNGLAGRPGVAIVYEYQ